MSHYDAVTAWVERGHVYERTFKGGRDYRAQEDALLAALRPLKFRSVLEVGCGFGRIGSRLVYTRPQTVYTGIDVSADMLASAALRIPTGRFIEASLADFAASTDERFDLVLVVEVLMHQDPADIEDDIAMLRKLARRWIVNLDWDEPPDGIEREGNFLHDYARLYGPRARRIAVPGRKRSRQAIWIVEA